MSRGRPTRAAAAASRAQQDPFCDFGVEAKEEIGIIVKADPKTSVSLEEALKNLNPEQTRHFVGLVGQNELDQILREEIYSQQSSRELFNNEELLKGLEIWSPHTFNDSELKVRYTEEMLSLEKVREGILEINKYDVRFNIQVGPRSSRSGKLEKHRILELKETLSENPDPSLLVSSNQTRVPEQIKVSPNRASPGPSANSSKLSIGGKKRFVMSTANINNNNQVATPTEDDFDELISNEVKKTKKKASNVSKAIVEASLGLPQNDAVGNYSDNLFVKKEVSTPQGQRRRAARFSKNDLLAEEHEKEVNLSPQTNLVDCPLCNLKFTAQKISDHAATCGEEGAVGDEPAEEEELGQAGGFKKTEEKKFGKFYCEQCKRSYVRLAAFTNHGCNKEDN